MGVSNYGVAAMRAASARLQERGTSLASNQIQLSLLYPFALENGLVDACRELDAEVSIDRSPSQHQEPLPAAARALPRPRPLPLPLPLPLPRPLPRPLPEVLAYSPLGLGMLTGKVIT